jgi:hypothetical protein
MSLISKTARILANHSGVWCTALVADGLLVNR